MGTRRGFKACTLIIKSPVPVFGDSLKSSLLHNFEFNTAAKNFTLGPVAIQVLSRQYAPLSS